MKNWIIGILVLVVLVGGGYMIFGGSSAKEVVVNEELATTTDESQTMATTTTVQSGTNEETIGKSVEGRNIIAYHYGTGPDEIILIGGIHGGYSWNTGFLAGEFYNYFSTNKNSIPENLKVTVIIQMNPDGNRKVTGSKLEIDESDFTSASQATLIASRFNANNVDLSRNFDCQWQATGMWQNKKVSGGSAPFSEPESLAIKNYIEANHPKAVVVYYSAAGGVYSSSCGNGILPETAMLNKTYATASGYPSYNKFDAYPTSGDMVNWLAKINVPAISVLLTNHTDIELDKNLAGVKALLARYAK